MIKAQTYKDVKEMGLYINGENNENIPALYYKY